MTLLSFTRSRNKDQALDLRHLSRAHRARARRAHRRLMAALSHSPKGYKGRLNLTYVWTCNAGHNWYRFESWDAMPKLRRDAIDAVLLKARYGGDPSWHVGNYEAIADAVRNSNTALVAQLVEEGKYRIESLSPAEVERELCTLLFVCDFEMQDVYGLSAAHHALKDELLKADHQSRAFFLSNLKHFLALLSTHSGTAYSDE